MAKTDPVSTVTVLSVSPIEDDHSVLRDFLHTKTAIPESSITWRLNVADTLEMAVAFLQKEATVAIVICEANLLPGTWQDLWEHVSGHEPPPLMIVTSQQADEYLWVEALNHGVYDVLRKPFDPDELIRVMTMASLKWSHRHKSKDIGS
jgi:DNA-binding NtrC family response regulator